MYPYLSKLCIYPCIQYQVDWQKRRSFIVYNNIFLHMALTTYQLNIIFNKRASNKNAMYIGVYRS